MKTCEYMKQPWYALLQREIERSNKTKVAEAMGVSRSTLSAVFNGLGEYGKGKAGTEPFARQFLGAFGLLPCAYQGKEVHVDYCRQHALIPAPIHNPAALRHWQACQQCVYKPKPAEGPRQVIPRTRKTVTQEPMAPTFRSGGKATSGEEAYQEGWDSIGGPDDNPYPVEDSRHDYWRTGFQQRRDFDSKLRQKMGRAKAEPVVQEKPQQAGVIDQVTQGLPEVGAPQVAQPVDQASLSMRGEG